MNNTKLSAATMIAEYSFVTEGFIANEASAEVRAVELMTQFFRSFLLDKVSKC
jgi:hypothetical protein